MKKSEIIFSAVMLPIDYILVSLAGLSAYFVRYSAIYQEQIREVVFNLSIQNYIKYVLVVAVIWIVIYILSGLYSMRPGQKLFGVLSKIFLASSTATLIVIVAFFFSRELFSSRFIILAAWLLSVVYVSAAHIIMNLIQKRLYKKGMGVHRIALVGDSQDGNYLAKEIASRKKYGYTVALRQSKVDENLIQRIVEMAKRDELDEIVQADSNMDREESLRLLELANLHHLEFKYVADLLGATRTNFDINTISGIPIIGIKKTPLDGWGRVVKRVFDIVASIVFLVVLSPLFLIVAMAIKIDSKGTIFYKSKRIGAYGKEFYLYKFRTMIKDADKLKDKLINKNERADGPLFKLTDDPRITRVGAFLRKTSIDEIPNFWNVLVGHMSLVGPRPHEPHEVAQYQKHHRQLLNIKPGITGMAQVSGRSTLSFEEEVKLDTLYIETWSFWLDIIILIKTPFIIVRLID